MAKSKVERIGVAEALLLTAITALGTWLFFWLIDDKSLWGDELNMIWFMTGERDLEKSSGNALWYVEILRFVSWFGTSDFLFRLPAALFAIPTIPLLYFTGRMLFNREIGLVSAFFLALSPMHISHAQQVHSYSLFCFLSLLSFYLLWRAFHESRPGLWLAWAAVTGLSLNMHMYTVFFLLSEAVIVLLLVAMGQQWKSFFSRKNLLALAASTGILVLMGWPLLSDWIYPLASDLVQKASGEQPERKYFQRAPQFEIGPKIFKNAARELVVWKAARHRNVAWGMVAIFLVGLIELWRKWPTKRWVLTLWILIPPWPIAVFAHISNIDYGSRRLIFILPMLILCVAVAVTMIGELLHKAFARLKRSPPSWVFVAAIALAVASLGATTALASYYKELENGDVKRAARLLELVGKEGDYVVAWRPEHYEYYYDGPLEIHDVSQVIKDVPGKYAASNRIWYFRPRTLTTWTAYQPLEEWVDELDPLRFRFGGGLNIVFHSRVAKTDEERLADYEELLKTATGLKRRAYLHLALAKAYRKVGMKQADLRQRRLAAELQ